MDHYAVNIEISRTLDRGHWRHLTQWRERVFPEEGIGKQWSEVSWHLVAFAEDGTPIGHIGFDGFDLLLDGELRKVIGVGGVVMRPEHQGQGIPALMFEVLHAQASDKVGADDYALFCPERLVPYYQKHGYALHEDAVWFLQNHGEVLSTFQFMHRGDLPNKGPIRIPSRPW